MDQGSNGAKDGEKAGVRFARARRVVRRRAAYRRWRSRVPILLAGPRPGRRLRPWYQRLIRATLGAGMVFLLLVAGLAGVAALVGGRSLVLPVWAVAETEARLNRALEGQVLVVLGGVEAGLGPGGRPQVVLEDLRLKLPDGGRLLVVPELRMEFDRNALMRATLRPTRLVLSGARIDLRRDAEGRFDIAFDTPDTTGLEGVDLAEALGLVWEVIDLPVLRDLARVEAEAMSLSLSDARAGRSWEAGDGRAVLLRQGNGLALDLGMALVGKSADPAHAQITVILPRTAEDPSAGRVLARFERVAAADLAAQAVALSFLGVLEAPISGELRAAFDGKVRLTALEGSLSLGAGALQPLPDIRPVVIEAARIGVDYDPLLRRLNLTNVDLDSPTVRMKARGHVDLIGPEAGLPEAFVGQIALNGLVLDPEGIFDAPLGFEEGAVDLRLRLDPFSVELGQLSLGAEGQRLVASGAVSARADGWRVALDVALDQIGHDRLLALWPVTLVPNTRDWLRRNVLEGTLSEVKAGIRLRPDHEPRLSMGYEFAGANVRIMPELPIISDGHGHAMLDGKTYVMSVERGKVEPPEGGRIDVARSVFRVPDVTVLPTIAEAVIRTDSSITAALSLLDQPPFGFLAGAGLVPELAEGRARLETRLSLPLHGRLRAQDVTFEVAGVMENLSSDKIVPGHRLEAARLTVEGDGSGMTIAGAAKVSGVDVDGNWHLPLGQGVAGSKLVARVALTPSFLRAFVPGIDPASMSGAGSARLDLEIKSGESPSFVLQSDLGGVGLNIAALGWAKPPRTTGKLEVKGRLGARAGIESFALDGPGLSARGSASLAAGGGLELLQLDRLRLGDWLDARAEMDGSGQMRVMGGRADLRRMPTDIGPAGGQSGGGSPMEIRLDSFRLTDGIELRDLSARLSQRAAGLAGSFVGRVNGRATVTGTIAPGLRGPLVQVNAEDGGAVLAASGLFSKARGGAMNLEIVSEGRAGHYSGVMRMDGFRVREMPALAELLGAISIVGLLDQLGGEGVSFDRAEAPFRLTPDSIETQDALATGPSFGLTLEGLYHHRTDRFDMQGVISPLYIVNAIGQAVSRPGEGLVGLTFTLRGSSEAPQIAVNPLSAIAPGFLRNLFRGPAARLDDTR